MSRNQLTAVVRAPSKATRRRWFTARGRAKRRQAALWASEAEVLRAMGECHPSPRGSPSAPSELPLARPRY